MKLFRILDICRLVSLIVVTVEIRGPHQQDTGGDDPDACPLIPGQLLVEKTPGCETNEYYDRTYY